MDNRPLARASAPSLLGAVVLVALALGASSSSARSTAALAAPTTGVLDDFDGRGAEDPLDQWGNWAPESIVGQGQTLELIGGGAGHNDGAAGDSYRVQTISGEAEVHATMPGVPPNNAPVYLYLHLRDLGGPGWDGYRLRLERWVSSVADTIQIQRIADGQAVTLAAGAVPGDLQGGDGFLLRQSGGTLTASHRRGGVWTELLSAAGGEYGSGSIGLGSDPGGTRWDDFGGSGETTPEPPPPTLPGTSVLDRFDRPDEDPLSQGGAWASTPITGSGQTLEALGGAAGHNEGDFVHGDSYRPTEISGDAEVFATVVDLPENNDPMYLYLHLQQVGGAGWDGYMLHLERTITGSAARIQKVTDGAATVLVSNGVPLANGDVFLLRRVGSGLTAWRGADGAWTKLMSTSDAAYGHGFLGAGVADHSSRWDEFGGGAIGEPPPPPPAAGVPPEQTFGAGEDGIGVHGKCACGVFADPVSSRTGAFTTSVEDLATPGTGVSFAWGRTYTSADSTVGRLGPGWSDSFSASLAVEANGDVRLHGEDGQEIVYARQADGSFVGAPGSLSTLRSVAGGWELVRADQVTYRFDSDGRLLSMRDRNGQGVGLGYDAQGRLTTVTDASDRRATIAYNADGRAETVRTHDGRTVAYGYTAGLLTSVTDVRGKRWTYVYDAAGRLERIVDPLNHALVTNVYGADGRVQSQTDALGKTTTFVWDAGAGVATATDARSNTWTHDYDRDGHLVTEADPLGNETTLAHDTDLNLASVTSPANETATMTYDAAGNLLTATAPASLGNATKTFVYNARNDVERVTDARGKVTDYVYDARGNVATVTQDGVRVASYTYDAAGRVQSFTDANEKTWTYTHFPSGSVESSTDPLGNKTTYTYWPDGNVRTRVDPMGNVAGCACASDFTWTFTYDAAGQLLTEENPLGHRTTNVYDDAGRLVSTTDARGHATSYTYDAANRVLTETAPDPDGAGPLPAPVTRTTYDDVGNKRTQTDARGHTTTFAHDAANRLISTTGPDPDGTEPLEAPVTTQTYDANGNLASTVEPRGNVAAANPDDYRTTFTYDAAGRLLAETRPDPDGAGPAFAPRTTNVYDEVGNLRSVTDGNGHVTSYTYDAAGRVLSVTAPDLGVTAYTYDGAGNLLTRTDALGRTTTFAYDAGGRLRSDTSPDPDGPGPQGPAVTTFAYDANGNRLTVTDANGNATAAAGHGVTTFGYDRANRQTSIDYSDSTPDVTFAYDAAGNRLSMVDGQGTEARTYDNLDRLTSVGRGLAVFAYQYDANGNVTRRSFPGGTATEYAYDALDRLSSVTGGGQTTTYAYDVGSNLVQTTLPSGNGHVESRGYDRAGRLTEVRTQRGASVLSQFVSTLDPVGNPTAIVRTGSLAQTQTYSYDASDRLTGVCFQPAGCSASSDPFIRWTYDTVGNRLSEQRPGQATTTYAYDLRDRLLSAGSTTFAYDQNGNQTRKGSQTFAYDLANRLVRHVAGATTTYAYDGDGKRLQASTGSQASRKTNFVWDVSHDLPQLALEQDGRNNLLRRYTHGVRRISTTAGSGTSYYAYDPLGSVANLTSSSGATQWTWSYEPFGATRTETKASGNQPQNFMKFAGEYLDPTGLYHLRARQYDGSTGRFLSPDPIGGGDGSQAMASYVYSGNRPTVNIDPSGKTFQPASAGQTMARHATTAVDTDAPLICISASCIPDPLTPRPRLVHPIPGGFATSAGPVHATSGLPGYPAIDFLARGGTPVLAVQTGYIRRHSGRNPADGVVLGSVFGWSTYLRADSGSEFFYTHLGRRTTREGQRVTVGQVIGNIGHWPGNPGRSHVHVGVSGGPIDVERLRTAPRVRLRR